MNKQVEAMKLALEALWTTATPKTEHAIAALQEALAEQPAQRKPLTDAEIHDLDPCPHVMFDGERIDFARAVEAAHGIKE